jgi:ribosomal protein S24E
MSLKLINENVNALFSRKEVKFTLEDENIPSKDEASQMIADHYKIDVKLVRIGVIKGTFGAHIITISADVYDSEESFKSYVKKTKPELAAEKKAAEEKLKAEAAEKKAKQEEAVAKAEAEKPKEKETKEEVKEEKVEVSA